MFPLIVEVITVLIHIDFLPPIQECHHWFKPVGIRVSSAKFDVDYEFCISVPKATDDYVTPLLQTVTPLMYIPLLTSADDIYEGFSVYR